MSVAETGSRGSRPGELHRRRVVLVAESAGLAAVLNHLLEPADRLSRIGSLRELGDSRSLDSADVVVLDVPGEDRAAAVGQIRRRYLGPLVVLAGRGDGAGGLHLDDACTLLARPFSTDDLGAALAGQVRPPAAPEAAAAPRETTPAPSGRAAAGVAPVPSSGLAAAGVAPVPAIGTAVTREAPATSTGASPPTAATKAADPKAAARRAPFWPAPAAAAGRLDLVDRVQRLLVTLTQGWQARRRVRVAGFSVFALVAFTVAFALAAQGRCGPGCDAIGTAFSPAPTVAPASSQGPSTTGPKRSTTTANPAGDPGTGAFRGISGGRLATTTTDRRATTTTRKAAVTTRPATTRPATTQTTAPPTTAPTTTQPPTTQTTTGA